MPTDAARESAEDAARELAVRLTEFFARSGWDGVAEPGEDAEGRPSVEVRSAEPLGPIPGRFAPHRARWTVDVEHPEAQLKEITELLTAGRTAPAADRGFTTQPVLPAWCLTD